MLSDSGSMDLCGGCMGFQDCKSCFGSGEGGHDRACETCHGTGVQCECMDDVRKVEAEE